MTRGRGGTRWPAGRHASLTSAPVASVTGRHAPDHLAAGDQKPAHGQHGGRSRRLQHDFKRAQSAASQPAHQQQHQHHQQHQSQSARGKIAPLCAVRPGRQGTDQHEDQDDQKNGSKTHDSSSLRSRHRSGGGNARRCAAEPSRRGSAYPPLIQRPAWVDWQARYLVWRFPLTAICSECSFGCASALTWPAAVAKLGLRKQDLPITHRPRP